MSEQALQIGAQVQSGRAALIIGTFFERVAADHTASLKLTPAKVRRKNLRRLANKPAA